jgi:hypothetical protein
VAREKLRHEVPKKAEEYPLTLDAADSPFLLRILTTQHSVLLADTKNEKDWPSFKGHSDIRSWLCVPLVASQQTLGLLSVGHTQPNTFTQDHLRRTQLLAIPAAAAIQNSRLYERAEIYGSELQRRLTDLRQTENALEQSEEARRLGPNPGDDVPKRPPLLKLRDHQRSVLRVFPDPKFPRPPTASTSWPPRCLNRPEAGSSTALPWLTPNGSYTSN